MKPEILALSIATATATPLPLLMHKSESHDAAGFVVMANIQQFLAAADLSALINTDAQRAEIVLINTQPTGRSLAAIAKLKQLAEGWDGADAPPPSKLAIENAHVVAEALESRGVSNVKISADVDGGVVVTVPHRMPGQYAAVACDNGGDAHLILEAPTRMPRVYRISIEEAAPAMIAFALA